MGVKRTAIPARPMRQVQQEDSFWIIVAILAVISFTGSFLFVYMMTSQVDVKDVQPVQRPVSMPSAVPSVTDLSMPGPSASNRVVPAGQPSAAASASVVPVKPSAQAVKPSAAVAGNAAVAPSAEVSPVAASVAPSTAPVKSVAPHTGGTVYRVQVGSFTSRQEAQQAAQQLLASGYSTTLVAEGDDYRLQVGSFGDQNRALALAEKIMATGQPVRIMKGTGE